MSNDDKSKRPANTAFKQQRLKAWQPILTPKTVLPTLFIIGVLFAPIGGVLFYVSENVSEVIIDYSDCGKSQNVYTSLGQNQFSYSLPNLGHTSIMNPRYTATPVTYSTTNSSVWLPGSAVTAQAASTRCKVLFELPVDFKPPVFIYYRLTRFYQNHRKYVKSFDAPQLRGTARSRSELNAGGCGDLAGPSGSEQLYYPCGLIANSMFNDTISLALNTTSGAGPQSTGTSYLFTSKGIAWSSDGDKYNKPDASALNLANTLPPPNWALQYPNGTYSSYESVPDLKKNEHFQVWMRTAGLPNFRKLYGRNDNDVLKKGNYSLDIDLNFETQYFGGSKSIVISTVSFLGGKNPFLGISYITVAVVCVLLGCAFTLRHLYKPRKLGDHTYLSWNQQGTTPGGGMSTGPDGGVTDASATVPGHEQL